MSVPSLTRKSMPTVEIKVPAKKAPSLKRTSRQVFPTPESPTSMTWGMGKGQRAPGYLGTPPGEGPVSPELAWPEDGVGEQQSGGGLQVHQGLGRHRAWTSNCLL